MQSATKMLAGETVRRCCQEEDLELTEISDASAVFHVHARFPQGDRVYSIYQPKDHDDRLLIVSAIDFRDYSASFATDRQRCVDFTFDLNVMQNGRPTMFDLEEADDVPRLLTISDFLLLEEFSKGALLRSIRDVSKSHTLAVLLLVQYFGHQEGPPPSAKPASPRAGH